MFKSPDLIKNIVAGTVLMLLLAVPRTVTSWDDLTSGAYSSLWLIWPMIGFGIVSIALAAWRTWGPRAVIAQAVEAPGEGLNSDREDH